VAPYGTVLSVAKLLYIWFDYVVGYVILVWPRLVRASLVISDRYFADVIVDPLRYRYSGPEALLRTMVRAVPAPDFHVILDAPASIIRSRKTEVTEAETRRQVEAYRELGHWLPRSTMVDASKDIEAVALQAAWAIIGTMAADLEADTDAI
jgi:thymidylate kinase